MSMQSGKSVGGGSKASELSFRPRAKTGLSGRSVKRGKTDRPRFRSAGSFKLAIDQFILKCMKSLSKRGTSKAIAKQEEKVRNEIYDVFDEALDKGDLKTLKWLGSKMKPEKMEIFGKFLRDIIVKDGMQFNGDNMKAFLSGLKYEGIGEDIPFQNKNGGLHSDAFSALFKDITKDADVTTILELYEKDILDYKQFKEIQTDRTKSIKNELFEKLPLLLEEQKKGDAHKVELIADAAISELYELGVDVGWFITENLDRTLEDPVEEHQKNLMFFLIMERATSAMHPSSYSKNTKLRQAAVKSANKRLKELPARCIAKAISAVITHNQENEGKISNPLVHLPLINRDEGLGNILEPSKIGEMMANSMYFSEFPSTKFVDSDMEEAVRDGFDAAIAKREQ